jgi:hypothetical protein
MRPGGPRISYASALLMPRCACLRVANGRSPLGAEIAATYNADEHRDLAPSRLYIHDGDLVGYIAGTPDSRGAGRNGVATVGVATNRHQLGGTGPLFRSCPTSSNARYALKAVRAFLGQASGRRGADTRTGVEGAETPIGHAVRSLEAAAVPTMSGARRTACAESRLKGAGPIVEVDVTATTSPLLEQHALPRSPAPNGGAPRDASYRTSGSSVADACSCWASVKTA